MHHLALTGNPAEEGTIAASKYVTSKVMLQRCCRRVCDANVVMCLGSWDSSASGLD